MLSEGLKIELFEFEVENITMKPEYLWRVVDIVIGGIQTVLEVGLLCLFMSVGRMLLYSSVRMNLFGPMKHQLDPQRVEGST
jgi:hypothetical protein